MSILKEIKTSAIVTLVLLVICCGIYPLAVYGAGQLLFPKQANGSLVLDADVGIKTTTRSGHGIGGDKLAIGQVVGLPVI